jgi:AcrR family transcriptional regulator
MVQKSTSKPRGRPRTYDSAVALSQAMQTFWQKGYAGTSVDDLCAATGLNKPSLYAGLGDKQHLYHLALQAYVQQVGAGMAVVLGDARLSLTEALDTLMHQAVSLYQDGRGCFLVSTTPAVAWDDLTVRETVAQALRAQDVALAARFKQAQQVGQLSDKANPMVLGAMTSALLHSLSLRARAGYDREALMEWAQQGVKDLLAR